MNWRRYCRLRSPPLATNFSYNTNQYFFEGFRTETGSALPVDEFVLTISYTDPVTGVEQQERVARTVSEALSIQRDNIADAESIYLLAQLISGAMERDLIQQVLDTHHSAHSSALFDEYLGLMEEYVALAE